MPKKPQTLTEIIKDLESVPDVNLRNSFDDLRRIASQHPNLRYVQWYSCRVCGIERRVCSSPFLPDDCICGKNQIAIWEEEDVP